MSDYGKGLDQERFCDLTGLTKSELIETCTGDYPLLPGIHLPSEIERGKRLSFADALAVEVARSIQFELDIPLSRALRLTSYAGGIEGFLDYRPNDQVVGRLLTDYWMAVVNLRSTHLENGARSDVAISGHYVGPLHQTMAEISNRFAKEEGDFDADPSRMLLINISAANRRLRQRATSYGIGVYENEFAAE